MFIYVFWFLFTVLTLRINLLVLWFLWCKMPGCPTKSFSRLGSFHAGFLALSINKHGGFLLVSGHPEVTRRPAWLQWVASGSPGLQSVTRRPRQLPWVGRGCSGFPWMARCSLEPPWVMTLGSARLPLVIRELLCFPDGPCRHYRLLPGSI